MRKRLHGILAIMAALLLVTALVGQAAAATNGRTQHPYVVVNGRNILPAGGVGPHYHEGRIYAPLSLMAEALGVTWSHDSATGATLVATRPLDLKGYPEGVHVHDDTLYAPVRAVAEHVGARVEWDGDTQSVRVVGGPAWQQGPSGAETLARLTAALTSGRVRVVDLSDVLSEETEVISLPAPFANTPMLERHTVSRFDEKGPAWSWNWYDYSEHAGSHFDVACHWISGQEKACLDEVPGQLLIGPAVVIDVQAKAAENADYLATAADLEAFEAQYGPVPQGAWVLLRTGWAQYEGTPKFVNNDENGSHTPGASVEFIQAIMERGALGFGVETQGIDAGQAFRFAPPFPVHFYLLGAGRFGLTQLINLDKLPPVGAVVVSAPTRLDGGTGSPTRTLAFVPEDR